MGIEFANIYLDPESELFKKLKEGDLLNSNGGLEINLPTVPVKGRIIDISEYAEIEDLFVNQIDKIIKVFNEIPKPIYFQVEEVVEVLKDGAFHVGNFFEVKVSLIKSISWLTIE